MGRIYARAIERAFPGRWDDVAGLRNDDVGDPPLVEHDGVALAPATWRYAFRVLEIEEAFGHLTEKTVAEVGGGYGGLAVAAAQLCPAYDWTVFDAPEPAALLRAYCLAALGHGEVMTRSALPAGPERFSVVVSDYALSELPPAAREEYAAALLVPAKRGAVVWNEAAGISAAEGAAWIARATGRRVFTGLEFPTRDLGLPREWLGSRLWWWR